MKTTRILQHWQHTSSTTPCHQCRLLCWTLLLVVLVSCTRPVCGQVTTGPTPGGGVSSSTQEDSAYREDRNASTPWPPDEGSDQTGTILTATTPPSTTTSSEAATSSNTSTENITTSPEASNPAMVTKVPGSREDPSDDDDVTTSPNEKGDDSGRHDYDDDDDDDGDTTIRPGFDVMQNKTFQVTLGVCMSLCGLLVVLLVLMMFYTKYRGWKDRMNVAPTVRTGGQIGTDRQELVT